MEDHGRSKKWVEFYKEVGTREWAHPRREGRITIVGRGRELVANRKPHSWAEGWVIA